MSVDRQLTRELETLDAQWIVQDDKIKKMKFSDGACFSDKIKYIDALVILLQKGYLQSVETIKVPSRTDFEKLKLEERELLTEIRNLQNLAKATNTAIPTSPRGPAPSQSVVTKPLIKSQSQPQRKQNRGIPTYVPDSAKHLKTFEYLTKNGFSVEEVTEATCPTETPVALFVGCAPTGRTNEWVHVPTWLKINAKNIIVVLIVVGIQPSEIREVEGYRVISLNVSATTLEYYSDQEHPKLNAKAKEDLRQVLRPRPLAKSNY